MDSMRLIKSATVVIGGLILSACANTGTLQIRNDSATALRDVAVQITMGGSQSTLHSGELAPGQGATVHYDITNEYYLYIEAARSDGHVTKDAYGYVEDSWRSPVHRIVVDNSFVYVDGESSGSQ
jgi:hypothetical protein